MAAATVTSTTVPPLTVSTVVQSPASSSSSSASAVPALRCAYFTLLSSTDYADGVVALARSLRYYCTDTKHYPLIVLVSTAVATTPVPASATAATNGSDSKAFAAAATPTAAAAASNSSNSAAAAAASLVAALTVRLASYGCDARLMPELPAPKNCTRPAVASHLSAFTKLRLFERFGTEFDAGLYLDADTIVTHKSLQLLWSLAIPPPPVSPATNQTATANASDGACSAVPCAEFMHCYASPQFAIRAAHAKPKPQLSAEEIKRLERKKTRKQKKIAASKHAPTASDSKQSAAAAVAVVPEALNSKSGSPELSPPLNPLLFDPRTAVCDAGKLSHNWNSGVLLLTPLSGGCSAHTFDRHVLPAFDSFQSEWGWCDQDLLNAVYRQYSTPPPTAPVTTATAVASAVCSDRDRERLHVLDWRFNAQKRMFLYAPTQWNTAVRAGSIAVVHYVGGKPWHSVQQRATYDFDANSGYEPLFELWRAAFEGKFPLTLPLAAAAPPTPTSAAPGASAPVVKK